MKDDFIKVEGIDYMKNFYRKIEYRKNLYLLSTDDGNFIFLNKSSLAQFKRGKIIDENTYYNLYKKGFILDETNLREIIKKTYHRYRFLLNGTSLHIVVPTIRCNQSCPYCFAKPAQIDADRSLNDMDVETAKKTVDFIMQSPSSAITIEFTGGEALARFDLIKIMVLRAKEINLKMRKNLLLTIVTNLTMMNDDIADWLIDEGVSICTSLDGPKEVHDQNRIILGREGRIIPTYDRVVYWIRRINEKYKNKGLKSKVSALMTVTSFSFPYAKEIIDLYVELGMDMIDIRGLMHVGNALEEDAGGLHYKPEDFSRFYEESIKYIDELRERGVNIQDRMRELYEIKILKNTPTYHTDYESPDGAGTGALTYHSDGNIYTCHEALGMEEFKLGSVHKDNWKSLFRKKEVSFAILSSMLENNPICDRCAYKPYCGTSVIENFSEYGKFNFNPSKSSRHYETIFHSRRIFDKILEESGIKF